MPVTKADMQKRLDDLHEKLRSDTKAAMQHFADDCKYMPPYHAAIFGRAEIEKYHTAQLQDPKYANVDFKCTVEDVVELGDAVIVDGKTIITAGGKEVDQGKFLNVLKKSGNDYKIVRATGNSNKPRELGL